MSIAVAITGVYPLSVPDTTLNEIIVDGTFTLSGNYGSASSHGDPVSFAISSSFAFGSYAPNRVEVFEEPVVGTAALGYQYVYQFGPTAASPTQAGGALCILGTGAASGQGGTEITQGSAYSGFTPSLNGAVLSFRVWFARL